MSLYVMRRLSKKASANAGVAAQRTLSNKRTQCERNYLHLFFRMVRSEDRVTVSVVTQLYYPVCGNPVETSLLLTREGHSERSDNASLPISHLRCVQLIAQ